MCRNGYTLVACTIPHCKLNIRWSFGLLFYSEVNGRTLLRLLIRDAAGQTENMLLSEYAPQWITDIVVQVTFSLAAEFVFFPVILAHQFWIKITNLLIVFSWKKERVTLSAMYSKYEFCQGKACASMLDLVVSWVYTRF